VDVCVVGGGPAGMTLALLLAHKGIKVLVLEKNRDFSREYRGEVLMPRFTQMFRQVHLDRWLEKLPHLKLKFGELYFHGRRVGKLDFSKIAPDVPYALWLPQVVLLEALHEKAKAFPSFDLWFGSSVKHLVKSGADVTGVVAQKDGKEIEVTARVTIGADGRYSTVFKDGEFEVEYEDYRFDILWFTIPKPAGYDNTFRVLFSTGKSVLLLPKYPNAIQAGILVAPHELAELRKSGIEPLKKELKAISPIFEDFVENHMKDFTVFHPLQAHLHFVKEWAKNGCLLVGDSAHCCSPAGAIGVSMAVGTAIVTADVLVKALKSSSGTLQKSVLDNVQRSREADVRRVHQIQMRLTGGALGNLVPIRWLLPFVVTLLARTPIFRRFQRQLMRLPAPLPIAPDLAFAD
jgi:2-polyprenyl-6-methoxyphenol hydroxylase-like FAD-dependent oxidoreductase